MPPLGCWTFLTLDCTTNVPLATTAADNGKKRPQTPVIPRLSANTRAPLLTSPSSAHRSRVERPALSSAVDLLSRLAKKRQQSTSQRAAPCTTSEACLFTFSALEPRLCA